MPTNSILHFLPPQRDNTIGAGLVLCRTVCGRSWSIHHVTLIFVSIYSKFGNLRVRSDNRLTGYGFSRHTHIIFTVAGNFRGVQFSRFSRISGYPRNLDPRNKYDCVLIGMIARIRENCYVLSWKKQCNAS